MLGFCQTLTMTAVPLISG